MSSARVPAVRRTDTVDRLVAAALEEIRSAGYEALTVRSVAARARVAPATAYTYFSSKPHLVAETFWRALRADRNRERRAEPEAGPEAGPGAGPGDRVAALFAGLADFLAAEPELAAAVTVALLRDEPEVRRLQRVIGAEITNRLVEALGERTDALEVLTLAWSGAMLQAGMGHTTYAEMGAQLRRVADLVLEEAR